MFGHRYFGSRYFGARYFGPATSQEAGAAATRIGRGIIIKRRQKKGFTVIEPERPAKLPEISAALGVTLDDVTLVATLVMSEAPAARRRRHAVNALLT